MDSMTTNFFFILNLNSIPSDKVLQSYVFWTMLVIQLLRILIHGFFVDWTIQGVKFFYNAYSYVIKGKKRLFNTHQISIFVMINEQFLLADIVGALQLPLLFAILYGAKLLPLVQMLYEQFTADLNAILIAFGVVIVLKMPILLWSDYLFKKRISSFVFKFHEKSTPALFRMQLLANYHRQNWWFFLLVMVHSAIGYMYLFLRPLYLSNPILS